MLFLYIYIGAGIHVFEGVPIGSHPNNGLVRPIFTISINPQAHRMRFTCHSDSTVENVGELIGLGGTAITSNSFFEITTDERAGELEVINFAGSNTLTSSEQGVYTCRIPLQSGVMREINIGIYPNAFNGGFILTINSGVFTWDSSWITGSTLESGGKITSVKATLCALHRMRLKGGEYAWRHAFLRS